MAWQKNPGNPGKRRSGRADPSLGEWHGVAAAGAPPGGGASVGVELGVNRY